jgi:hypothetical protein
MVLRVDVFREVPSQYGLTIEGHSVTMLRDLLVRYERSLSGIGYPTEALQPGRSEAEIRDVFASFDLEAPDEVVALYEWHDGVDLGGYRTGFGGVQFWPLSFVSHRREADRAHAGRDGIGSDDWQWNPKYVQIFGDNNGIAVDCSTRATPAVKALDAGMGTNEVDPSRFGYSLCTVFALLLEGIGTGDHRYDPVARRWTRITVEHQSLAAKLTRLV